MADGAAERQRRCRDRQRRGVTLAMGEVSPAVLDDWIDRGWITEEDACDPDRLGDLPGGRHSMPGPGMSGARAARLLPPCLLGSMRARGERALGTPPWGLLAFRGPTETFSSPMNPYRPHHVDSCRQSGNHRRARVAVRKVSARLV